MTKRGVVCFSKGLSDLEKVDEINLVGDLKKKTKFAVKPGVLKTSLASKEEESRVKYSSISQCMEGFTSVLVMNSYLNDNVEDKHFYFNLDSFSTVTEI